MDTGVLIGLLHKMGQDPIGTPTLVIAVKTRSAKLLDSLIVKAALTLTIRKDPVVDTMTSLWAIIASWLGASANHVRLMAPS